MHKKTNLALLISYHFFPYQRKPALAIPAILLTRDIASTTTGWSGTTTLWSYTELSIGAAVCNLPVISRFLMRRWWGASRQAIARTMSQVATRNRRVVRRENDLESFALESGTLDIAAGTRGSLNATNDKPGQGTITVRECAQKSGSSRDNCSSEGTGHTQSQDRTNTQSVTAM